MADFIVEGPDGKKYKASGDSIEAVKLAVEQTFGGGVAAPTAAREGSQGFGGSEPAPGTIPAEPSLVDRIMGGAKTAMGIADQGVRGMVDGAVNILGAPGDIGAATNSSKSPVQMVGGLPFLTSDAVKGVINSANNATADLFGAERPRQKPEGFGERAAHRVGEEVGAMAIPAGTALKAGTSIGVPAARAAVTAAEARFANPIARFFGSAPAKMVESAAVAPGKFVAKETSAAAAAGGGAAAVNSQTGKDQTDNPTLKQNLGDMLGSIGGVGAKAVFDAVKTTAKTVYQGLRGSPDISKEVVGGVAAEEIARLAGLKPGPNGVVDTAPLAAQIEGAPKVSDTVPGYVESLADRTQNPGIAAAEYSRQSGPNSGDYVTRRTENTGAVDAAMSRSEPQGTPGAFGEEARTVRDRQLNEAATARATAEDAATTAVQPLQPTGTPAARGDTVRGALDEAHTAARDADRAAYEAAGINSNPLAPTHLAEALDSVTAALPHAERIHTPQALIDRIANIPPGSPITLNEATALKTQLIDLQAKAAAEPGGRNATRILGRYLDAVEEVIDTNISTEQRAALAEARAGRRATGDAFERRGDPVAGALATYPGGNPKMANENVARTFTDPAAMDRLFAQADTPATRDAIRNEVLSNADTSSAAGLYDFQQRFREQLNRFPGLDDQIGTAIRARVVENTARGAEGDLISRLGTSDGQRPGKSTVGKYLAYGDENATKAMQTVLSSKDPAKAADELLTFVGDDPKAVEGARKVFWDIMQKHSRSDGKTIDGVKPWVPRWLDDFVNDPAKAAVAERLYRDNPEHWANIQAVNKAIQGVDTRSAAKAMNSSGTAQAMNESNLPSMETLASRAFAVQRGVVSPAFAGLNIAGIIARKAVRSAQGNAINKAIDGALLNPDFAAALLKENNPANRAALARSAKGWMGNEASTLIEMLQPDEEDGETKAAVMRGKP